MKVGLRRFLKGESYSHEEDHTEGWEYLCDRISQDNIDPTYLLLQVSLGTGFSVWKYIHDDTETNVQEDDHLDHK